MSLDWNREHDWQEIPYHTHRFEAARYKCRFCDKSVSADEMPDSNKCPPTYKELLKEIERLKMIIAACEKKYG